MKKILSLFIAVTLLFLAALPSFAAEQMSAESFQAMTPYGVPEAHDTDTTLRRKPAIFWGHDVNGVVTFSDGTKQSAFNASCIPIIQLTPEVYPSGSTVGYEVSVYKITNTGFEYQVRQNSNGTVTDVTSSVTVHWTAFGWK